MLLLATFLIAPAAAQTGNEVEINLLSYTGEPPVTAADTVVLISGWGACTPRLVRKYIQASNHEVTLDGRTILTPAEVAPLWGPVGPAPTQYEYCISPNNASNASWRHVLGPLAAGEHTFYTEAWTERLIHDGRDVDGEKGPDKGIWCTEGTITVTD